MTQTRFVPRPGRDPNVRRRSIVYGFKVLDPGTGRAPVDYVGKTVQELSARERQHRGGDWDTDADEQPWSDLIVGKPFIIEQGLWTAAELDERERHWIREIRPRYNYEFNLGNPNRIPIPVARRQREARDAAAGRVSPSWPAAKGLSPARSLWRPRARRRSWTRRQKRAGAVAAVWLLLTVGFWWVACRYLHAGPLSGLEVGGLGSTSALLGCWSRTRPRRSMARPLALWTAGAVAVGALLLVSWPHLHVPVPSRVAVPR